MSICLVCRFYGFTLDEVKELTLPEFSLLSNNMVKISEIENPVPKEEEPQPLRAGMLPVSKKPKNSVKPKRKR